MDKETAQLIANQEAIIKDLKDQLKLAQSEKYVGVTNVSGGDVQLPSVNGNRVTGEGYYFFGSGQSLPVLSRDWEYCLNTNSASIRRGLLVRDDSVLVRFGKIAENRSFDEGGLFPDSLSDDDIRALLASGKKNIAHRVSMMRDSFILQRIRLIASEGEKNYYAIEQADLRDRALFLERNNVDTMDMQGLIALGYEYILNFDPEKYGDESALRSELKSIIAGK